MPMTHHLQPGLLLLQGNRLERLAETLMAWLTAHPLPPLESETILVQSNGMAEWLKMEFARTQGICAGLRIELPARFVWRAYAAVLGAPEVPSGSPLNKAPLTWRLMQHLPDWAMLPGFEPIASFLQDGHPLRRFQLAQRLADLFDQYQVYRSDWLEDWAHGCSILGAGGSGDGGAMPLPPEQAWQAELWRRLMASLRPGEEAGVRSAVHQRFLRALQSSAPARSTFPQLPRRIVLFGTTHIPHSTLEALAALSRHTQVLMAVPNPCRYHWADLIEGRERLNIAHRRHAFRQGRDLSVLSLRESRQHGHPLLAAWGRQSRDFIRQLDAFDDAQAARDFQVPRVDLFDDSPGQTLLEQVQVAIRDLLPLEEHPGPKARSAQRPGPSPVVLAADRSIVFHVAHSPQREVEVLHDQLLHLLAHPGPTALEPRDVVVMVPDIETFAPSIRAVFGQYPTSDPRHIPWGLADMRLRHQQPMLLALDLLLRAPLERFTVSQVRSLLEVPSIAARWGLQAQDLGALFTWIEEAGIRWGLNQAHRKALGFPDAGDQNTWSFGLRRIVLGYATGDQPQGTGFQGIEPYGEVAGLAAPLAGVLDALVQALIDWWHVARQPHTPQAWGERLRSLLQGWFDPQTPTEHALLSSLKQTLADWLQVCDEAGFAEELDLVVLRQWWMGAVDEPGLKTRFKAGGVTFCTLLPLRAIPFEVVCLLGMNDSSYPRRGSRMDFDLMGLAGHARPGDRSRRDDDRQLMLDALLSARRVLYVSWAGRSLRDNQEQAPSVLVNQLRDYLAAGWSPAVVSERTTEHPLQAFSARYREHAAVAAALNPAIGPMPPFTYAQEWWPAADRPSGPPAPRPEPASTVLTIRMLVDFLKNPAKAYFQEVLQVHFSDVDTTDVDDEVFTAHSLQDWQWRHQVLQASSRSVLSAQARGGPIDYNGPDVLGREAKRLDLCGALPWGQVGARVRQQLIMDHARQWSRWLALVGEDYPQAAPPVSLSLPSNDVPGLMIQDLLSGLRLTPAGDALAWVGLDARELLARSSGRKATERAQAPNAAQAVLRNDRMLPAWVQALVAAAGGVSVRVVMVGRDACIEALPIPVALAQEQLQRLLRAYHQGLHGTQPWPTALKTGMAYLAARLAASDAEHSPSRGSDSALKAARSAFEGHPWQRVSGEGREPCLARLYPDADTLVLHPQFGAACETLYGFYMDWLHTKVAQVQLLEPEGEPGAGAS